MNQDRVSFLEKIEEYLLKSNIHIDIVEKIMRFLFKKVLKNDNLTNNEIIKIISDKMQNMIAKHIATFDIDPKVKPYVMLVCGVNGSGKTTTVGKMVNLLVKYNWDLVVAECDTYRANTVKQLCSLIDENSVEFVHSDTENQKPITIAIKAYNKAVKEKKDILIIDTSGKIQVDQSLMAELAKIKKKLNNYSKTIPNDVVLVVDSNCGYESFRQVKNYNNLIGITGIIATKLDISGRPGMIFSICEKLNVKIFGFCDGVTEDAIHDVEPKYFIDMILNDIWSIV